MDELLNMGFKFTDITKAIESVGPRLDDALEFILSNCSSSVIPQDERGSSSYRCPSSGSFQFKQNLKSQFRPRMKQSKITDHLFSSNSIKGGNTRSTYPNPAGKHCKNFKNPDHKNFCNTYTTSTIDFSNLTSPVNASRVDHPLMVKSSLGKDRLECHDLLEESCSKDHSMMTDLERKVCPIISKHFGFSTLRAFQKDAIEAFTDQKDCLVLAATGSGKSICFQIPALLTGKVVIVVSPLISLMRDQCLKLAQHGISACFLGSGQLDSSIESKAMCGMYKIVYVCPETIQRLISPLKLLYRTHGICLFAVDEVHCVSKWGHDFRPDYRKLSVLRENFPDIPIMALTATATMPVRADIIRSLGMSNETKVVLTSFFRPNLRFSVKFSRTTASSYKEDFRQLIETYTSVRTIKRRRLNHSSFKNAEDEGYSERLDDLAATEETGPSSDGLEVNRNEDLESLNDSDSALEAQLTVGYLEDEVDIHQNVDDLDVPCGEYPQILAPDLLKSCGKSEFPDYEGSPDGGPTIIYVPTRKETVRLSDYLIKSGVRAAAYHAKLPKAHLRRVHEEFHHNSLEVVVATVAFGMGIDKPNVRTIIHYGWPQCLEAYYQEAGRAGRDGKLSDCILYANLSRIPTLLPSQRSEEQTRHAYRMLSDCFRYGMNTSTCRAKVLVRYFGEELTDERCHMCDTCVSGPPELQNLKEEADIFIHVLKSQLEHADFVGCKPLEMPTVRLVVSKIREQSQKFCSTDRLWWQGLARILEDKGYIREGHNKVHVSIKYPEPTELGCKFLNSGTEMLHVYPEADMLLSLQKKRNYSSFSEWGRGWADPEIRRQRLQRKDRRPRKKRRRSRKNDQDMSTSRGRIVSKLSRLSKPKW